MCRRAQVERLGGRVGGVVGMLQFYCNFENQGAALEPNETEGYAVVIVEEEDSYIV